MALDAANNLVAVSTFLSLYGEPASASAKCIEFINSASWFMNKSCGRKLKSRALTEYYDVVDPYELILREYPVTSVTTLHNDSARSWGAGSLVAAANYKIERESGMILMHNASLITGKYFAKVVYTAGFNVIPWDLKEAAMELVAKWYDKFANKRIGVRSVATEARTITYEKELPPSVKDAIAFYRRKA